MAANGSCVALVHSAREAACVHVCMCAHGGAAMCYMRAVPTAYTPRANGHVHAMRAWESALHVRVSTCA